MLMTAFHTLCEAHPVIFRCLAACRGGEEELSRGGSNCLVPPTSRVIYHSHLSYETHLSRLDRVNSAIEGRAHSYRAYKDYDDI
jgi:hypothetical protein